MRVLICSFVAMMLLISLAPGQSTRQAKDKSATGQTSQSVQPAAAVGGSGTQDHLAKWTAGGTAVVDSYITEDKFGKVTVPGLIEAKGGIKFADGSTLTNGSKAVTTDNTLKGTGESSSPLGLNVPLIFAGSVDNGNGVITVTNVAAGGPGIFAVGGNSSPSIGGGSGVLALGGTGAGTSPGGAGMVSFGGSATNSSGGTGGSLIGGVSTAGNGGDGLFAVGALGVGTGKKGGRGIVAIPGGGAGGATAGLAGDFIGDVEISGNLSKGGGSFKIDHPLDPENKYLYHSFVESPDMMNIYNGNITTDENGDASVELPEWFEALNKGFRYQLTVIGTFAQAIVAEKIKGNRFAIKTNVPNVEVSWQVTGIRRDAYAEKHRIPVEEAKPATERGYYLHPDAFNQPEERSVQRLHVTTDLQIQRGREASEGKTKN